MPNYKELSFNDILEIHKNKYFDRGKYNDNWMVKFFKLFNINTDTFKFDIKNKYNHLTCNNNDILLFRFEDFKYVSSDVLPKYNIFIKENKNVSSKRDYRKLYEAHKKYFKVSEEGIDIIKNSKIVNIYYTTKEIEEHIKKYDTLSLDNYLI